MFTYITNFFNYLFNKNGTEESDDEKERFLAEELLQLEIQSEKESVVLTSEVGDQPRNAVCVKKTGIIKTNIISYKTYYVNFTKM